MEAQALTFAALGLGLGALVLASLAYWRAGIDVSAFADRVRYGHRRTIRRAQRGRGQLQGLDREVTPSLRGMFEVILRELDDVEREARAALEGLRRGADVRAQIVEEGLARKMRRLEGRVEILSARTEMTRAERLAQRQRFLDAENLLEDAVAKVREVKARVADDLEDEPSFDDVVNSLQTALRAIRAQANDHKARIDRVVSASDALLAALEARESARPSSPAGRGSFH
ncbi:MAG: hypothetical protein ACXWUG_06315 [Polyangiales bacterium]